MGSYRPLFSIRVGHGYFSSGEWRGLDFVPTPATKKILAGADILVRKTNSGMAAFYSEDRADSLRLYIEGEHDALPFQFKVYSGDKAFANYTAPLARNRKAVPFFDNRSAEADAADGKYRLSKGESVSDQDLRDIDELLAGGMLDERDRHVPPDFLVEIVVRPGQYDTADRSAVWAAWDCYLNFEARNSFWRYFLLGSLGGDSPSIVDPDNRVEFEACGEVVLAGNRAARMFRSKNPIPLQEAPTSRFQLRTQGTGGPRVFIKRLPVASESRLGMEVIDGKKEVVFENYINF